MKTQYVHISDISVVFGDYTAFLNFVSYDEFMKWHCQAHKHTNYELHVITRGGGTMISEGRIFNISAGSLYLTGPGVVHEQTSDGMDEYGMRFDIVYTPGSGDKRDNIIAQSLDNHRFFISDEISDEQQIIGDILTEAHMQLPGFRQRISGLFASMIVKLARTAAGMDMNDVDPPFVQTLGGIDVKARLDTYFFGNNFDTPSEKVINDLHLTRRNFSRLMKKYYGMTYAEKQNEKRIIHAKELLRLDIPYSEVWQRTGFNSAQYFSRVFKQITGETPNSYKKRLSGEDDNRE